MGLRDKIYSIIVLAVALLCLYCFYIVLTSSLMYEKNRNLFNKKYFTNKKNIVLSIQPGETNYNQSQQEVELFLRSKILDGKIDDSQIALFLGYYYKLLNKRPTWPYYFSGIVSINKNKNERNNALLDTMAYGRHETKIVRSLAEILFSSWQDLPDIVRLKVLKYLINQTDHKISETVKTASKFAKVYEFCDYLFFEKRIEHASCKAQYWQPLSDI